jgi:cobalt-zinc-cadmium efflux system protein
MSSHSHQHDHDHEHRHGRGHGHSHAPTSFGRAFAIGTALNLGFVVVEATYGVIAGSMALLADAGHNLSDVLGLLIAWVAATLAGRKPGGRYTYGLRSSSILAAFLNALLLLVAVALIAIEAAKRFSEPAPVAGSTVMIVAAIGIVINGVTALMFMSGRKGDLNIRGAFLHMAADAAVSAGVVVAGFAIVKTGLPWIDPVVSLVIVAVIAIGTWGLLRDSVNMSLHASPAGIDPGDRSILAITTGRRHCPRPPCVAAEHDRDGTDGAPAHSRRLPGRWLHRRPGVRAEGAVRHRPYHYPDRDRSRHAVRARARGCGLINACPGAQMDCGR